MTDGRTDGRTDGIAIAYARLALYAVARKNQPLIYRVIQKFTTLKVAKRYIAPDRPDILPVYF